MSDQQPPADDQINGGGTIPPVVLQPETAAAPPPKRQRRPSVRLGDIGDQHTYDNTRRNKQNQWKFLPNTKSSKTRPLVNLTTTGGVITGDYDNNENHVNTSNGGNDNNGMIGSWKGRDARDLSKSKRGFSGAKRVRSNWGLKLDDGDEKLEKFDDGDDDFEQDDDDQSLNFSMDKETRIRVSDGVELEGPSDTDARNWNNNNHAERNGVRVWLNQLGLGRYAPVFEVHEVDDEVLPLLTLEDLKDMGINAVGSRRKMFCSIQKLGKGFS